MKRFVTALALSSVLLQVTPALSQENPFAATKTENPFVVAKADRYGGVFQSDAVKLELTKVGPGFEGSLFYSATGQTYPVRGRLFDDVLQGTFNAGGTKFGFSFQLNDDGAEGAFETEGYSGTLTSEAVAAAKVAEAKAAEPVPVGQVEALFNEALALANTLPEAQRSSSVFTIALYKILMGDVEGGRTLGRSLASDDIYRDFIEGELAAGVAKDGDIQAGYTAASLVANEIARKSAIIKVIGIQAAAGDLPGAFVQARSLGTPQNKISGLTVIATHQINAGDKSGAMTTFNEAEGLINQISEKTARDAPRFSLGLAYARAGEFRRAEDLIDKISADTTKTTALSYLAQEQAKAGDMNGAKDTLRKTENRAKRIDKNLRFLGVIDVAVAKTEINGMADGMIYMKTIADPLQRSVGMLRIATLLLAKRDFSGVRSLLQIATIDPSHNGTLRSSWATALAADGKIEEGIAMARSIPDPMFKANALASIAGTLGAEE